MNSHAFTNCGDFRGNGYSAVGPVEVFNPSENYWYGANATTYILLAATGSLRWSATGTVYATTELYLESAGDVVIKPGGALDFDIAYATGKTGANVYIPCKSSGVSGYYIRLYT